ncbi:MAG: energy-coupling factor transporter ATPase [Saccharofermentanales bacterium]
METFIELKNVSFEYRINGLESLTAVDNVSMTIPKASHVAILGRNGSGKSTLARLINGLEIPASGEVIVDGIPLNSEQNAWEIRKKCGIVFQNPDNQIIGTTVEEDVAFGPENLGMPREQMIIEIDKALEIVGLISKKKTAPHLLSGGQKQKLAIAGIIAMSPACCILDEATSMLDPTSRKELMSLVSRLVRDKQMTVVNITHHMEEAIQADYIYIMSEGTIVKEGIPKDVFEEISLLRNEGLDVPVHIEIAQIISEITAVPRIRGNSFTLSDACSEIGRMCETGYKNKTIDLMKIKEETKHCAKADNVAETVSDGKPILTVNGLSYTYSKETIFACDALKNVNFEIFPGELFGIVGQAGSGKSTLVQHFNGLIRPQTGKVIVMGYDTSQKTSIRAIRKRAGLLFQYPEHQLFEETVYQDIAFGPKCLGFTEDEIKETIDRAIMIVGLNSSILDKSPFELSGGQKRRVAIAGIVAMRPDILILDEPAAGLDPAGRDEILTFIKNLCSTGITVVLVSHNMDDIARLADRILVLKNGENLVCAAPEEVFSVPDKVAEYGLSLPIITEFMLLMKNIYPGLDYLKFQPVMCANAIVKAFYESKNEKPVDGGDVI